MVNEAARTLEERIVVSAADVDLGMIMGTGFPPFRGGLLKYADDRGINQVAASLSSLEQAHGTRFTPCAVIADLAKDGGTFYGAFPGAR